MVGLLLWLSLVTLSECKSLTVNPRLKKQRGPIELSTEHLKADLFEGSKRHKRDFEDFKFPEHGSDWGNDISIIKVWIENNNFHCNILTTLVFFSRYYHMMLTA